LFRPRTDEVLRCLPARIWRRRRIELDHAAELRRESRARKDAKQGDVSSAMRCFPAGAPTPSSAAIHADNEHTVGKSSRYWAATNGPATARLSAPMNMQENEYHG
jgi:hypothetical protein